MLRACDFSNEDICSVLAHASSYFMDTYTKCGEDMDENEVGNVMALLIFLAHSYVQDETCRLKVWHKYLFSKYCSLAMLSSAVMRLLEIRSYILRLEDGDLNHRYTSLLRASATRQLVLRSLSDVSSYPSSPSHAVSPSTSVSSRMSGCGGVSSSDGCSSMSTVRSLDVV
jgi:hypothetical protein